MIINPILPLWLMGIICILFLLLKRKGIFSYIRQILVVILLFVINLRIMIPNGETSVATSDTDILFVVDNTISMLAEDCEDGRRRIDVVKEDCKYIMEQFPGASYSVISFGNLIQTMLPYTIDQNIVSPALDSLNGQATLYARGTSLNDIMKYLQDELNNTRENYQVVFFISDGENTSKEKLGSFPELDHYVDDGIVLGYGTAKGGAMKAVPFTGSEDEPEYLYYYDDNFDRQNALSKIDEGNLKKIASDLGVDYVHMTKQSDMDHAIKKIVAEVKHSAQREQGNIISGYEDIYYIFVIPLLLLLVIDYICYRKKM